MAKIMLADDEQQVRDMVAFKLKATGHQVVPARDGGEAMALAAAESPDLIILDIMMPVLDGFEVLKRLKADPALHAIPVIILSAKGREQDVLAGLRGGAVDYIVKPFSLKELTARVELALRKREPEGDLPPD
jgi:two-component system alkaline phosphatase synthesis response regulator PhoP